MVSFEVKLSASHAQIGQLKGCNSNFLASILVSFIWGRVSPLGNESPFCKCLPLYLAEFMKTAPAGKCKLTIKLCWDPPPPRDSTEFDSDFPFFLSLNCFYETKEFLVLPENGFYQQQLHLSKCSNRFWGGEQKGHAPFSTTTTTTTTTTSICVVFLFCFVVF